MGDLSDLGAPSTESAGRQVRVRVKVCGITSPEDALSAAAAGVDAIGLNFAAGPRRIEPDSARRITAHLPPLVSPVAVFLDADPETIHATCRQCGIGTVQLHGDEPPELVVRLAPLRVIKAFRVARESDVAEIEAYLKACSDLGRPPAAVLLDTRVPGLAGGTGKTFDWRLAGRVKDLSPLVLAGGLGPDNVADAVRAVRPFAVDASSRLESAPGRKDPCKVRKFVAAVRTAEEALDP